MSESIHSVNLLHHPVAVKSDVHNLVVAGNRAKDYLGLAVGIAELFLAVGACLGAVWRPQHSNYLGLGSLTDLDLLGFLIIKGPALLGSSAAEKEYKHGET